MARLVEEAIVIKMSKLVRDSDKDVHQIINETVLENLEAVLKELAGDDVLVELYPAIDE